MWLDEDVVDVAFAACIRSLALTLLGCVSRTEQQLKGLRNSMDTLPVPRVVMSDASQTFSARLTGRREAVGVCRKTISPFGIGLNCLEGIVTLERIVVPTHLSFQFGGDAYRKSFPAKLSELLFQ